MKIDMRGETPGSYFSFKPTFFGIVTAFALALFSGSSSQAQNFYPPSVTLQNLISNNGTILVGDKLFSHFGLTLAPGSGPVNTNNINVEGIEENGSDYGIQFSGPIVANDNALDFTLQYQVNVTNSANLISQANLSFNGVVVGGAGEASVTEAVYTNMTFLYGDMTVFATQVSSNLSTSMAITPPQAQLNLDKDVLVYSLSIPAFSQITTINQSFHQVAIPEPSTVALAIMGIAGALLTGRRKRSSCL